MHLPPVPGPRDLRALLERGGDLLDQLVGAIPRMATLLDTAELLIAEVTSLLDRIEQTRTEADTLVRRADVTRAKADEVVEDIHKPIERLVALLDLLEPPLLTLQPTLDRLAQTTSPREVDALTKLVDQLPVLLESVERDVLPMLVTLRTVSPDVHDLLDASRELNDLLGNLPGMGRIKKRVEQEQEEREEDS